MITRVERGGGPTAMSFLNEMDAKSLSSILISTTKKILVDEMLFHSQIRQYEVVLQITTHKISVNEVDQMIIVSNEYNIHDDLQSLIQYIEKNSSHKIN